MATKKQEAKPSIIPSMDIVNVEISQLIPSVYNPRKITGKELDELRDSIEKYGMVEPVIVNSSPERKNIIISGHQRAKACQEMGIETVPVYYVNLNLEDEKELNIRMNKNGGQWDFDLLKEFYDKNSLIDWGFLEDELNTNEEDPGLKEMMKEQNAIFPLVPLFSEKYDYVIIFAKNEIDNAYLHSYFNLETQKSYKSGKVGIGRVVEFEKFKQIVKDGRVG